MGVGLILFLDVPSEAQYTADFQTNAISGVASNWVGDYIVGSNTVADALLIQAGGALTNWFGWLGYEANSGSNLVLVTDPGSTWFHSTDSFGDNYTLTIGNYGSDNSLVVSNGARVINGSGLVGYNTNSVNNRVTVSGSGSVWSNTLGLTVGVAGSGNTVVIDSGGRVFSTRAFLFSSNNTVIVTGGGSVWGDNGFGISVGTSGSGNSLVISNGGNVYSGASGMGTSASSATGNLVLVTGPGSVWSINGSLNVGSTAGGNRLTISDHGQVTNGFGSIGVGTGSSNNSVRVLDSGVWRNNSLIVGNNGGRNSLFVVGGSVFATGLTVGNSSATCDNLLQLDSGNLVVTNSSANAVFEVRRGKLILNGGTLQVDRFVMTNTCAQFIRTGGTLIYGTAVLTTNLDADGDGLPNGYEQSHGLDPLNASDANMDSDGDGMSNLQEFLAGTDPTNSASAFRIIGIAQEGDDIRITWTTAGGRTNVVQTAVDFSGNYSNISPNIVVSGSGDATTNYLDAGAATNAPTRFYRIRLVP